MVFVSGLPRPRFSLLMHGFRETNLHHKQVSTQNATVEGHEDTYFMLKQYNDFSMCSHVRLVLGTWFVLVGVEMRAN